MDEVTQQNSALVEENAATAKTLEQQANAMNDRVGFFRLDDAEDGGRAMRSASQGPRAGNGASKPQLETRPKQQPASRHQPAPPKRVAANGGPVGRMQAAIATAVKNDADWQEF